MDSSQPLFFLELQQRNTVKRAILRELRERGVYVWVDIENLTPARRPGNAKVERAIRGSLGNVPPIAGGEQLGRVRRETVSANSIARASSPY